MTRKFSLAYLTVGDLEPSAQVYVAAQTGYDYVGLRPIPMGLESEPLLDIAHDPRLHANCKAALEETGVQLWDIELARVLDGVDYDRYAPAIECGAELGAKVLLTSIWTPDPARQVEGLARVADLAAQHDMQVVAEFVVLSPVKTLASMASLIRQSGADNLGMLIDMYHFDRADTPVEAVDDLPPEWFPMLHLCDAPATKPVDTEGLRVEVRERRLYVGEGDTAIAPLLRRLPDDIVLSIEQPHLERLRTLGDSEYAARCLRHAKDYLAANGIQ
ncbi:sugar phosphate isomerase/epimerase family protein [Raineyella fluvialis]|uniref:TIM barrel protein n=1 Tax=Raineyella fluvialis TaxID=2662261 RepID=A0A5Q2F7A2_9ACTN|nr:sugar phosphate isomerase/epimerase [Raineyella fluvialis]QGF22361.1 TIM barrel protein [Raineyella fluvialis]